MELRHYLRVLERRKWVVIVTTAMTLGIVSAGTFLMVPVYSATATVRIAQVQGRVVDRYDLNYTERLINTYVELIRSRPFLEQVIERLELGIKPEQLEEMVKAEALVNTELLRITAESNDPATAMLTANTLGELLVEEGDRLYTGPGKSAGDFLLDQLTVTENRLRTDRERLQILLGDDSGADRSGEIEDLNTRIDVREQTYGNLLDAYEEAKLLDEARANSISVVEPAAIPEDPVKPSIPLNLTLGFLVGFASGIGLAFLFENFDMAVYVAEELEHVTKVPHLGSIPNLRVPSKLKGAPLLLRPNGKSSAGEAFRLLSSNLLSFESGWLPRTLMFTSVEADAGKSTILANLAVALAQAGRNVIVVDSDLRNPSLDRIFGVSNTQGLKNAIVQQENLSALIQQTKVPRVSVLTSGPLPHNPAELLALPRMREVIGDLANWADVVLLDSPPLSRYADAVVLAPSMAGVALVVGRGKVTGGQVERAVAQLTKVGAKKLGFIFNRADESEAEHRLP